jgi:hypothetical protein
LDASRTWAIAKMTRNFHADTLFVTLAPKSASDYERASAYGWNRRRRNQTYRQFRIY